MKRLLALLTLAAFPVASASRGIDPWPSSAVLTRLFVLPASQPDGRRLAAQLDLTAAQVQELRRLAGSEGAAGAAGRQVVGRQEAARLNVKIAEMNAEKDRKVRALLGGKYPSFRDWVRVWWNGQVNRAER